jgi:ATP-dependent protease ClpP protease subunit
MAKAFLFDVIDQFSIKGVTEEIKALKPSEELELHINSPGGDVFAGFALFSLLRSIPNKVTTIVDGLAGSIASVIALAGDEVHISEAGSFMVHNASVMRGGNKEEMNKASAELAKIDKTIVDIYVGRTKQKRSIITNLMNNESILDSKEAFALGFADKIVNPIKAVALINPNKINMSLLDDVQNKAKAFLGLEEEDKSVKALLDAADIVAQNEQKEKEANSLGADLLTADMVKSVEYSADMALLKDFVATAADFIKAQPTEEQINKRIAEQVAIENKKLLAQLKSNTQVQRATTQPLVDLEEKDSENIEGFNNAFDKIKEQTNKIYN